MTIEKNIVLTDDERKILGDAYDILYEIAVASFEGDFVGDYPTLKIHTDYEETYVHDLTPVAKPLARMYDSMRIVVQEEE